MTNNLFVVYIAIDFLNIESLYLFNQYLFLKKSKDWTQKPGHRLEKHKHVQGKNMNIALHITTIKSTNIKNYDNGYGHKLYSIYTETARGY